MRRLCTQYGALLFDEVMTGLPCKETCERLRIDADLVALVESLVVVSLAAFGGRREII